MFLDGSLHNVGGATRHELGHVAHNAMHGRQSGSSDMSLKCYSEIFNAGTPGHTATSCEYGETATIEGIATFIAARSITTTDTNVWFCLAADNSNQDVCSECVLTLTSDPDRVRSCNGVAYAIEGIGDMYANLNTHCARLKMDAPLLGCDCPDADEDLFCDPPWYQSNGFRNEVDVTRFLWDMIDTYNDGGQDDTYESMITLAADFEGITCVNGSGYDVDGTCNEPARSNPADCEPVDGQLPGLPMKGTRDSYNVYDLAEVIAGDQTTERTLNCVQAAGD